MNKNLTTFRNTVEKPLDKHFEATDKEDQFLTFVAKDASESYKKRDFILAAKCADERGKLYKEASPILSKEPGTVTNEDQKKMHDFFLGDSVTRQKSLQARHENFKEGLEEGELNLFPGLDDQYLAKSVEYREKSKNTYNEFCLSIFEYDSKIDALIKESNAENNKKDKDNNDSGDNDDNDPKDNDNNDPKDQDKIEPKDTINEDFVSDEISSIYDLAGDD